MKAAFGKVSITPPINGVYPDFFFGIPTGVLDDIYARIAVMQTSDSPVIAIAVDTLGFGIAEISELEDAITDATGVPADRILITSSHSHSAPILCPIDLYGGFSPYFDGLRDRAVKLATDLLSRMAPVTLSFGRSSCDFNVNRRRITPEGTCVMAPNPEGVIDKSVPILACHGGDDALVGVFFSYCCHPTILLGPKVSGDYPGQAQLALETRHRGAVALYLPGMFGNVRPKLVGENGRFRGGTPVDAMRCGSELADAVDRALTGCERVAVDAIRTRRIKRPLPLGDAPSRSEQDGVVSEAVRSAQASDAEKAARSSWNAGYQLAMRQWAQQVRLEQAEKRVPATVDYTFSRWDIGDVHWMTFSGEFFLEYGLYAQELLGGDRTFTLGYTQGCQTYVPTAQALGEGGYEPNAYKRWRQSAPFAPAVEVAVKAAIRELADSE
ncbi:MAG: hypothetical protein O7E52_26050 [Candidatus Poribacteria bacterium]|nr:hypothetical protein [Candidatus Poribacteria bacterium]